MKCATCREWDTKRRGTWGSRAGVGRSEAPPLPWSYVVTRLEEEMRRGDSEHRVVRSWTTFRVAASEVIQLSSE